MKKTKNKTVCFLKSYWMSITLCLVILYLCFMDTQPLPKVEMLNFDKFVHLAMYLTMSLVVFFESTNYFRKKISTSEIIYFSFFFPIIYSGLIEIGQEYIASTRTGEWMDFVFNSFGAFAGLIICLLINKRLVKK